MAPATASGSVVRPNQYYDSVFLMGVSQRLSRFPGVRQTAVLMASERNKELLAEIGVGGERIRAAGPNDLIVAVIADSLKAVEGALAGLDEALRVVEASTPTSDRHALEDGLAARPDANLVQITIPGSYVFREARKAIEAGLNLFIFSSNVPIDQERELKLAARGRGLLVMGPDCGTSILNGVGLGFANAVRQGSIGAIGPSGTGLQEFSSLIHRTGLGISHAIGTGSHDLSDEIGGLTTLAALDRLEADRRTAVIAIVAKPAGKATVGLLAERLARCAKPTVACVIGSPDPTWTGGTAWLSTIDEAVEAAVRLSGERPAAKHAGADAEPDPGSIRRRWASSQRYLRGLFAGGTLCYQAQQILRQGGVTVYSNAPLDPDRRLAAFEPSREHTLVDMGDEAYTLGRLHPMIDGTLRRERLLAECADPSVAVVLLDFILGYNASPDPVGDLLDALHEGLSTRPKAAGEVAIVASICGTDGDPQDLERQTASLRRAGAVVFDSSAQATRFCRQLLQAM